MISATFLARFHAAATVLCVLLIPPSIIWWRDSVPYLVFLSVWANLAGHFSSWQAARVEVKQDEQAATQGDNR